MTELKKGKVKKLFLLMRQMLREVKDTAIKFELGTISNFILKKAAGLVQPCICNVRIHFDFQAQCPMKSRQRWGIAKRRITVI